MLPRFGENDLDQENRPETRGIQQMLPPEQPDRIHVRLDAAVADAYGWPADLPDAEILERLLALNLERAGAATNSE